MPDYGNIIKKICFESTDKLHADLKIRLHYDDLRIREFFIDVVTGYVDRNEHILDFIEELKKKKAMSNPRRNKIKRARLKEEETIKQFGLNKDEIENIFDIIGKEHGDL